MQFAIQATIAQKLYVNRVWEPPKHDFRPFGAPFGRLLDALGPILDAFGTLLAVSLASLEPLGRFWKHLKCIWERFGSYMESIWDPFARFLRHILIKEPPRCLASRRGASQYAGIPNPISVLNVPTSGLEEVSAVISCLVMVCSCYSSIVIAGRGSRIPLRANCFCSGELIFTLFLSFFD